jgi:hypothetical protein
MTQLLEKAVQAARSLPATVQDEIARTILLLAEEEAEFVELTAGERSAIAVSRAAAARGEFASEAEVQAVWVKHGL